MARKTVVTLIDDMDGDNANRTVTFSVDGVSYEIDLNENNIEALTAALDPFVKAARKGRSGRVQQSSTQSPDLAAVRAWARGQGLQISDRGRVSREIINAYEQRT